MPPFTFTAIAPQTPVAQGSLMSAETPPPDPFNFRTPSILPVVIEPLLIDTLAHDFKVEPMYRANMHAFVEIALSDGQLGKSDIISRLYLLAASYADISERRRLAADQGSINLKGLYQDIMTQLSGTYTLTTDQKYNIRKVTNDFVYQWNRTSFVLMHADVLKHLRENKEALGLANVFGNLSREKTLLKTLKITCSSVRNALRQDVNPNGAKSSKIRDSIAPGTSCSLAQFTFQTANKYRRGQFDEDLGLGFTLHNALLRRFGLDNFGLLKMAPESADDGNKPDESDNDLEYEQPDTCSVKRSGRQNGRTRKGEDFWSKVDAWFAELVKTKGVDLTGPLWKSYITEVINRDNAAFNSTDSRAPADSIPGPVVAQGGSIAGMMSQ
ncbi:hypothetical protein HWV62_31153 [Athelia sp. TMB]|nr:hypothetical protein HWV62_31153 [Athelia sp. TMB]